MTDAVKWDYSEVLKLGADLGEVPANAGTYIYKAFQVAAGNVKTIVRREIPHDAHLPGYPYSIDYDISTNASMFHDLAIGSIRGEANTITAVIGPDKNKKQGALGNLIEYGSINNPAEGNLAEALFEESEDFEYGLRLAVEQAHAASNL